MQDRKTVAPGKAPRVTRKRDSQQGAPGSTEYQPDAPESTDVISLQDRRVAAELRTYGYVRDASGLHRIRVVEDKETLYPVGMFHVGVSSKQHIYSIPEHINDAPKEKGVVLVTELAPLHDRAARQVLEIHRADMLSRQPKFIEQITSVKPPHKQRLADFIDALEALGMLAPVEKRYNATGLLRSNGQYVLLHPAGGAVTAGGLDEHYQVQFPLSVSGKLTSIPYGWRALSTEDSRIEDFHTLLKIAGIAPGSPGYGDVLLGVHGFAPMSQLCSTGGVWAIIHGLTGSMKSASSRLPLQGYAHVYGRQETSTINLRELASTPYAIEQVLYYLAGMFSHLDDGLKGNNVPDKEVKKFYKVLSTLGGHAVTKQGGKRGVWGQGEGGFGIEPYPRGSGVYTVETLPDSESYASDLARYIVVPLDNVSAVNQELLTELQDELAASAMNRATASYIAWLLPRMDAILSSIPAREDAYREKGVHSRTPTSYAKLETGMDALLQYGVSIGALSTEEAARMIDETRARLVTVALKQKAMMGVEDQSATANDAVTVFYTLLRKAFREHKLFASDASLRPIKDFTSDGTVNQVLTYVPQPPAFLTDPSEDATGMRPADNPRVYGWRWNESSRVFDPESGAVEAGVLKWDGALEVTLHVYARDFKEVIYPRLKEMAAKDETPLPGLNEMVAKLKSRGKLKSTKPTNLHGRNSRTASCYILDMTPEPEPDELDTDEDTDGLDAPNTPADRQPSTEQATAPSSTEHQPGIQPTHDDFSLNVDPSLALDLYGTENEDGTIDYDLSQL